MKHIGDLFSRYKERIKPPQASVIKAFVTICNEVTGFTIKEEYCSYNTITKTIHLTAPSVLKSELIRRKSDLLQKLQAELGGNAPTQII